MQFLEFLNKMTSRVFFSVLALELVHSAHFVTESSNSTSSYAVDRHDWYGDMVQLPNVLKWKDNVTLENSEFVVLPLLSYLFWPSIDLRFDPAACGPGLFITNDNTHLRQNTVVTEGRTCRTMIAGWMHGTHYWSMRVINHGLMARIIIGIVPSYFDISIPHYPGATADSFGLYLVNGNKYNGGQPSGFSTDLIRSGDIIGVLLDLHAKTLTFFKNGHLLGTAFGHLPVHGLIRFYPAVTFYDMGSWISLVKTFK